MSKEARGVASTPASVVQLQSIPIESDTEISPDKFESSRHLSLVYSAVEPSCQVERAPEPHSAYDVTKRAIDVVVAAGALVALAPVFLAVSIVNFPTGGVFFRQRRIGYEGKEFTCLKFRSMVPGAEELREALDHLNITSGPTFKNPEDPRLTRLGRFLRRTSIDELPQLINVLRGEMSLVGPRPLAVAENRYEGSQHLRLSVVPGLTCIWQVSGRSKIAFDRWMQMDLEYVSKRSLWFDLKLLLRTIPAVFRGEGAF